MDVFSFGLVLFYCLTGGKHAFGESYERDFNIMQVPHIHPFAFFRSSSGRCFPVSLLQTVRLSQEIPLWKYSGSRVILAWCHGRA